MITIMQCICKTLSSYFITLLNLFFDFSLQMGDIRASIGDFVIHPLNSIAKVSSFIPHSLSLLQFPDSKRLWRPLIADEVQFCDVQGKKQNDTAV